MDQLTSGEDPMLAFDKGTAFADELLYKRVDKSRHIPPSMSQIWTLVVYDMTYI